MFVFFFLQGKYQIEFSYDIDYWRIFCTKNFAPGCWFTCRNISWHSTSRNFFSMNQPKAGKNVTIQKIVAQWLLCVLQNALFFRRSGYFVVFLSSPCWEDNLGTLLTERGCSRNLMHPGGTFLVSLDLLRKIYISKLAWQYFWKFVAKKLLLKSFKGDGFLQAKIFSNLDFMYDTSLWMRDMLSIVS